MKNRILLLLTAITVFMSCSNSTEPNIGVPRPSPDIGLSFVDENGKDLLNPEHQNFWNADNLDIYYLKDGKKIRVFDGRLDYPENFKIFYAENQDKYAMELWSSVYVEDGYTTTFIEFPDGKMDTIKIKVKKGVGGSLWAQKLWYNEELLWEVSENGKPLYFIRTKGSN